MMHDEKQGRRSTRLEEYDYAARGAYFVTLCARNRECLFGRVVGQAMRLNPVGRVVAEEWARSSEIRQEIELDEWVVMPNHIHAIIVIIDDDCAERSAVVGAHGRAPLHRTPRSLGSLVAGFKSAATKRINAMGRTPGARVWQRNYYDRVIRNQRELDGLRRYIADNPRQWALDPDNPAAW